MSIQDFEPIYAAWLTYGVVRIRGQHLDEAKLQTFGAQFDPLEEAPLGCLAEAGKAKIKNRYVTQLSNIVVNGKPIGKLGPGFEPFDDPRDAPGAIHSAVLAHRETGRKALYLGRREWAFIPGLILGDSGELLDELSQHAALPDHVWRQQWRHFDLIIWDNRRVLHRRDDFDANARHLLKPCQVLAKPDRY